MTKAANGMRVLVCGGTKSDEDRIFRALDALHEREKISHVITGASGSTADQIAYKWAVWRGIKATKYPAYWDKHGMSAGPIRNQQMIDEGKPDCVVAFPGGQSADMIERANAAKLWVWNFQ